jgi:sterol desaturase/sphingolipid hydroxylase (fatty acid hydroxylase superfamily)
VTTVVAIRIAFTIVFFIAFDFGRFLAHSLLHDIAALWPFHKVHHSAEVLTPITSYRIHPVEMLMMAWVPALMTGIVTWAFNRLAGAGVTFYSFLGLHVLIWVFNLIDNLRHSPVWLSYGLTVGHWLVSPAHHQLHHSVESRHWGCNRGSNLAIWDRLYGTLYVPGLKPETFRLGLGDDSEEKWHSLWTIYVQPFKESLRTIWALAHTRSGTQS